MSTLICDFSNRDFHYSGGIFENIFDISKDTKIQFYGIFIFLRDCISPNYMKFQIFFIFLKIELICAINL